MLSFFKINVFDRAIVLLLLLLAIRLPIFISGTPDFAPQLYWLLIGEKLGKGFVMYRDVWETTAPIPSLIYMLLNYVAGKSELALQLASFALVFWQSLIFNRMGIKQELYSERTFIPAVVYMIGANLFYDFLSLSPMLIAITFMLLALERIFRHIRFGIKEDELFLVGFYIGLAALSQLSLIVFLLLPMVVFLLYTGTTPRLYALILLGFLLTFSATFLLFLALDAHREFYFNFIATVFTSYRTFFVGWAELLPIAIVPLLLAAVAFFKVAGSNRFINYQVVCQAAMGFWLVFSVLALWLHPNRSPHIYLIFWPAFAFLFSHFFMLFKKKWQAELFFMAWFLATLVMLYVPVYKFFSVNKWLPLTNFEIPQDLPAQANKNQKIVVLGRAPAYYVGNSLATPYLNYNLSKRDLHELDYYSSVLRIYENFSKEMPDVIVKAPKDATLDSLFVRMPLLARHYQVSAQDTNVYVRMR